MFCQDVRTPSSSVHVRETFPVAYNKRRPARGKHSRTSQLFVDTSRGRNLGSHRYPARLTGWRKLPRYHTRLDKTAIYIRCSTISSLVSHTTPVIQKISSLLERKLRIIYAQRAVEDNHDRPRWQKDLQGMQTMEEELEMTTPANTANRSSTKTSLSMLDTWSQKS